MNRILKTLIPALTLALATTLQAESESDSLKAAHEQLHSRVESMAETQTLMETDISLLKRLKVSGYVQARFEYNDSSRSGVAGGYDAARNLNANNIYIRRGRIKFTFEPNASSRYVIYFDASRNTISLREAYIDLTQTHKMHTFMLTAGQFNWPFGYEIELSSSRRDFPERSLAENRLFRGERDRGINLTWTAPSTLSANLGVFQGYGIENTTFTWFDPTKQKDIIARVKASLPWLDFGVSAYRGETYTPGSAPVAAVPGSTTWYDADGDREMDSSEVTTTAPVAAKAATAAVNSDKIRYGFDVQKYLDVLPVGGTSIRAELYYGKDYQRNAVDLSAVSKGFYLWVSQSIGTKFGAAARYDFFDPNIHGDYKEPDPAKLAALRADAVGTWSFALNYYYDAYVRITAAYDVFRQLKDGSMFSKYEKDLKDNRFTLQFQFAI